jgi:predicted 2-oxoglutarate/Fe(II)-dependent dioxygenase YbiX
MPNLNPEVFADKIFYYKSIIEKPSRLVELIESTDSLLTDSDALLPWKKWTASDDESYVFGYQKQTNSAKLGSSSDTAKEIYLTLIEALTDAGRHYCKTLNLEYFPPSPLSISKYIEGCSMGPHVDEYPGQPKEPVMSGVIYLNDDCEGGELDFPEQGVRIKPEAGSIVIFPSVRPFYHQSLEVTSGYKYMSPVFWIKNN